MTRPRWMRKRSKVTNLMDTEMKLAFQRGHISWRKEDNPIRTVSFKQEDGTTDKAKYIKFFSSVFAVINESYTKLRKKELTKKETNFLLFSNEIAILYSAINSIYTHWGEIEKELIKAEELRLTNEVPI